MLDFAVQAFVAFVIIVDPVGMAPMFVALTRDLSPEARRRIALRAAAIAGAVLFAFGFAGLWVLGALGIGFPAFRIAGGILLLLAAIDMLFARPSGLRATTDPENQEAVHRADVSVFPLAIPLIAGPGAMTTVVLQRTYAEGEPMAQAIVFGALALVLVLSLLSMLFAGALMRGLGVTGVNVVGRVLGIVLAALACQLTIDGLIESGLFPDEPAASEPARSSPPPGRAT